jgi:hypothetical protein
LFSVAFHPNYAANGFLYVNYTDLKGDTAVARYTVSADPNAADPASAAILLSIPQPFANHNGGQLQFGPDGYLYIGMGDGGSGGNPQNNTPNLNSLLGKMMRIDVDAELGYGIPTDNPFVGDPAALPEIWASGLRNPWRFSFDRLTGNFTTIRSAARSPAATATGARIIRAWRASIFMQTFAPAGFGAHPKTPTDPGLPRSCWTPIFRSRPSARTKTEKSTWPASVRMPVQFFGSVRFRNPLQPTAGHPLPPHTTAAVAGAVGEDALFPASPTETYA